VICSYLSFTVILNLGRNSTKFVHEGFVRFKAAVVDGNVELYVEDSGQGITEEMRGRLFEKYQTSLDRLSQGTGIGLSLCKNLVSLLNGDIELDETYHSGIPGQPGAKFVIRLHTCPLSEPCDVNTAEDQLKPEQASSTESNINSEQNPQ